MRLTEIAELLDGAGLLYSIQLRSELRVTDLAYDSRSVTPGSLFFCIKGRSVDGHDFAPVAMSAGAAALVVERTLNLGMPELLVENSRESMSVVAAPFFGFPSREMALIGITGTNGKTTTSFMLQTIFREAGDVGGLIGTIERRIGAHSIPAPRNTPESVDLQRLLRQMRGQGVGRCVMEVTSEGIEEGRIAGSRFALAAFGNLSQDHLSYHGTIENYYAAKRKLFVPEFSDRALINSDDQWGRRLAAESPIPVSTYAIEDLADFRAVNLELGPEGSKFTLLGPGCELDLSTRLPGRFNVYNATAAAGAAILTGIDSEAVEAGIEGLPGVPGRFEKVEAGQAFLVFVDYAHTPDGLENVLHAARSLLTSGGRLLTVFGCGGDRDRGKRPMMGKVASDHSDIVFITSDNPRSEDPISIIAEVEAGLKEGIFSRSIVDRAEAIHAAIHEANFGDVVVIAGKGHETYQEFAGRTVPFDDREVAADAIEERS